MNFEFDEFHWLKSRRCPFLFVLWPMCPMWTHSKKKDQSISREPFFHLTRAPNAFKQLLYSLQSGFQVLNQWKLCKSLLNELRHFWICLLFNVLCLPKNQQMLCVIQRFVYICYYDYWLYENKVVRVMKMLMLIRSSYVKRQR